MLRGEEEEGVMTLSAVVLAVALRESFVSIVGFVGGFGQTLLALALPSLMFRVVETRAGRPLSGGHALLHAAAASLGIALVAATTGLALVKLGADDSVSDSKSNLQP